MTIALLKCKRKHKYDDIEGKRKEKLEKIIKNIQIYI